MPAFAISAPVESLPVARPPAPSRAVAVPAASSLPEVAAAEVVPGTVPYTVKRGDSLWKIADAMLGDPLRYTELTALNADRLGGEPDFLTPGLVLLLPAGPGASVAPADAGRYVVQPGDTLSQIAKEHLGDASAYPQIVEASHAIVQPDGRHLTDPDLIYPGWKLDVAPDSPASVATPAKPVAPPAPAPESKQAVPEPHMPAPGLAPVPATPSDPAPTSPTLAAPTPTPGRPLHLDDTSAEATSSHAGQVDDAPGWLVPALIGPGTILAAGVFLTVRSRLRNGRRRRTPGQVSGPLSTALADVSETVRIVGQPTSASLRQVHLALTSLAATFLDPRAYPPVLAVEVTDTHVRVHLSNPTELPSPWVGNGTTWRAQLDTPFPDVGIVPPYPMLVSVGQADNGALWLLSLERLADTTITGPADAVEAFGRHVATELAVSPWAKTVQIDVVGFAPELSGFGPGRITHHDNAVALDELASQVEAQRADEDWDPEILRAVIVNARTHDDAAARLDAAIHAHASRPGVICVRLAASRVEDSATPAGIVLADARLLYPALELDVAAVGLPAKDAVDLAALVEHAHLTPMVPAPPRVPADGSDPLTDTAGSVLQSLTVPRLEPDEPAPGSLLPEPAATYADLAAVTVEDVSVLAPVVPDNVAQRILDADPDLDRDLAMWKQGNGCPWPRLTILGQVDLRGHGPDTEVASRRGHFAELATYLWLHPQGTTSSDLAEAFGCSLARVRADMTHLRAHFGERHVPKGPARNDPTYAAWPGYHLVDVLVDRDLFDRLRTRAQARAATDGADDGIKDLITALKLVSGQPLTDDRLGNAWHWYYTEISYDRYDAAGIVDVALTVQAYALAKTKPDTALARWALGIALSASPYSEEARQALANVADVDGDHVEAEQLRSGDQFADDDDLLDPPARTLKINASRRNPTPRTRTRR